MRSLDKSEGTPMHPRGPLGGPVRWSLDGSALYSVGGDRNGRPGLYRVAENGTSQPITETNNYEFDWSPDAKYVFIVLRGEKIRKIVRRATASGQEKELYSGPRTPRAISVSPDGRRLAFVLWPYEWDGKPSLCLMPADGGEIKTLYAPSVEGDLPWNTEMAWTPDGENVLFTNGKALWIVPAAGGPVRQTDLKLPGSIGQLSMHPNGKRIAFTNSTSTTELWALENFLK